MYLENQRVEQRHNLGRVCKVCRTPLPKDYKPEFKNIHCEFCLTNKNNYKKRLNQTHREGTK
jgi:LSD1 subclass zinc finger protein